MKVILFSTQWPEYMIELANALSAKCDTVLMLSDNHRITPKHKELISPRVKLEPFHAVFHKSIRDNFRMLSFILRVIWRHKPDILHIQSNGHRLFYWIFFLKPFKTKIVNTIHDPVKHAGDRVSQAIDDRLVKQLGRYFTKKYIVHAEAMISQLQQSFRVPAERIVSIPHGHFEIYKKFQTQQLPQEDNMVLFFGRIWAYKGLEYFIDAANLVCRQNNTARFYIVGAGDDMAPYIARIKFPDRFTIVNKRVSLDEAGQYFQRSTMVVLPYTEATQSGVIPVAYAYARPVVATRVGGLPEVVEEGVTGFLVEPCSAAQIAERIIFLLDNPQQRSRMGTAAYTFAHRELSWERIADLSYKVYDSVA